MSVCARHLRFFTFMLTQSIFCFVSSRTSAERIVHDLQQAGFPSTDVGTLFFDRSSDPRRDAPVSSLANAPSAGPIGGNLAWIAGIGQLGVPGVGVFNAAGPVIGALHQARNIKPGVPIAAGLIHLGLTPEIAVRYERRIKAGGWLMISVHPSKSDQTSRARAIFSASNAHHNWTIHPTPTRRRSAKAKSDAGLALPAA